MIFCDKCSHECLVRDGKEMVPKRQRQACLNLSEEDNINCNVIDLCEQLEKFEISCVHDSQEATEHIYLFFEDEVLLFDQIHQKRRIECA